MTLCSYHPHACCPVHTSPHILTCRGARGRKLTPLEAHDLVCKVAEIVVVGGVRR